MATNSNDSQTAKHSKTRRRICIFVHCRHLCNWYLLETSSPRALKNGSSGWALTATQFASTGVTNRLDSSGEDNRGVTQWGAGGARTFRMRWGRMCRAEIRLNHSPCIHTAFQIKRSVSASVIRLNSICQLGHDTEKHNLSIGAACNEIVPGKRRRRLC